jgi:NagD protein
MFPRMAHCLANVRHLALDMDGTIYSGGTLFKETLPFLETLKDLGIGWTFLTNNSSRSSRDYLLKLERLGIPAAADQLYTSTQATIEHLRGSHPGARRLFFLATPSMISEMREAGFHSCEESATDEPDAVVVGFDTTLSYARLCRAAWWISKGKPFIATHPDRVCPTDEPTVLVDCGAMCAALERATGRVPDKVLGKPDPCMIEGVLQRHRLQAANLAMVGDRLHTDMAMARSAGAVGVLVLTGETRRQQIESSAARPDLIVENLECLGIALREACQEPRI